MFRLQFALVSQKAAEKAAGTAKDASETASAAVTAIGGPIEKVYAELHKDSVGDEIRLDIAKLKARIEELELASGPPVDIDPIRHKGPF